MKKFLLIGLVLLTTGCHTLTGALIGGGLGGIIGGRGGAVIGTAIGAGVGNEIDMAEARANLEVRAKSRETKVIDLGNGKKAIIVHGRLAKSGATSRENVRESNCEDFCERIGAVVGKEKSKCIQGCSQILGSTAMAMAEVVKQDDDDDIIIIVIEDEDLTYYPSPYYYPYFWPRTYYSYEYSWPSYRGYYHHYHPRHQHHHRHKYHRHHH